MVLISGIYWAPAGTVRHSLKVLRTLALHGCQTPSAVPQLQQLYATAPDHLKVGDCERLTVHISCHSICVGNSHENIPRLLHIHCFFKDTFHASKYFSPSLWTWLSSFCHKASLYILLYALSRSTVISKPRFLCLHRVSQLP